MLNLAEAVKPNIYEYSDFRIYLSELFEHHKRTKSYFSYRYFARRAGFSSPNFLKLVISGQRNLTEDSIKKFSTGFQMTAAEGEYFSTLVHFTQSKSSVEQAKYLEQMVRSRGYQKTFKLRAAHYEFCRNWYNIPIREMVAFKDFDRRPEWIQRRLRESVSTEDIEKALQTLQTLDFIYEDSAGKLRQRHETLNSDNEIHSCVVRQYHREMIARAADSLDAVPQMEREISSVCVPVSATSMQKIKKLIQDYREQILAIANGDTDADRIYQLNFQFFPLSNKPESKP